MAAIAAGVSMRRYAGTLEELPPSEKAQSVSKSATSRRFVALSEAQRCSGCRVGWTTWTCRW
jgi:putative transposase